MAPETATICVSFIAGILGIAYPILLEVLSRLDEKYSSQIVLDLFNSERVKKVFTLSLYTSIVFVFIWFCNFPPLFKIPYFNFLIENSALYLLSITTGLLIISFIWYVNKIILYYTPLKFLPYLVLQHRNRKETENLIFFNAISDLLYYSIKKQNEALGKTISGFMYDEFKNIRDRNQDKVKGVEYPHPYYEVIYKSIEELATQQNKRLAMIEHRTAGSVWILGEFTSTKISELTYSRIWYNLQLALKYDRDDYIIYHWETAFQYIRSSLDYVHQEYSNTPPFEIINQKEYDERINDREKFLEFHYALGGLLLYRERYKCLYRCFRYTQSIPPQHELLPKSMNQVLEIYFNFRDPYEMKHSWISSKYPFPDLGGLEADYGIKKWICQYTAVLFLRQYSIVPYLITQKPLDFPAIPKTQSEKRIWIDNLDYFKELLIEVINNQHLLKVLHLDFITDSWCDSNKIKRPLDFIDELKKKVEEAYEGVLVNQPISTDKAQKFRDSTAAILEPVITEYHILSNTSAFSGEVEKLYINGVNHVVDKSGFADDVDATHLNYDTFLAESQADKYRRGISEAFFRIASRRYLLKKEDMIPAIKKLNCTPNEYVIISFGGNLSEVTNDTVKGFEILHFGYRNPDLVGDSLFILKKYDLPFFNYKSMSGDEIRKYSLNLVIDRFKVYTSLVDLNLDKELRDSLEGDKGKDLLKSAFTGIFMIVELIWKKGITCIQLQQESYFRQSGIKNNLTDVEPIITEPGDPKK